MFPWQRRPPSGNTSMRHNRQLSSEHGVGVGSRMYSDTGSEGGGAHTHGRPLRRIRDTLYRSGSGKDDTHRAVEEHRVVGCVHEKMLYAYVVCMPARKIHLDDVYTRCVWPHSPITSTPCAFHLPATMSRCVAMVLHIHPRSNVDMVPVHLVSHCNASKPSAGGWVTATDV